LPKEFISEEVFARGPWHYFERAIARYFVHKGWDDVDHIGKTGDMGADLICTLKDKEYVVQVKHSVNNSPLSVDIVGDVVRAMKFYEIEHGYCISNRNLGDSQKQKLQGYKQSGYDIQSFTGGKLLESVRSLPEWISDSRTPRNYQHECIEKLKESYNLGGKRGLISLATGMGKTYVACSFIRWLYENDQNLNILILAHRDELLKQFDRSLWPFLPKWISTHILTGKLKPNFNEGILLSTFESFPNWNRNNDESFFDIIIVDEAHHSRATTYQEVLNTVSPNYLLGLTATPYRQDGLSVTDLFGKPLVYYSVAKGIKQQFLSEVDYNLRCDNIDESWIQDNSLKGYTIKQLNKKLFLKVREEKICDHIINYWNKEERKRLVIFCQSIDHAEMIQNILNANYDFSCSSITNKVDQKENAKRLRQFRKGEIEALTVYNMLNEGVDVPDIDFICFLRVTHSRTYFLQQLGRGLRYQPNKRLLVLDFVKDLRQIKAVQRQYNEYFDDGSKEFMDLEPGFNLKFSNDFTDDFLKLVSEEIESEFIDRNQIIV